MYCTSRDSTKHVLPNCILLACLDGFLPTGFIPHATDLGFAFCFLTVLLIVWFFHY